MFFSSFFNGNPPHVWCKKKKKNAHSVSPGFFYDVYSTGVCKYSVVPSSQRQRHRGISTAVPSRCFTCCIVPLSIVPDVPVKYSYREDTADTGTFVMPQLRKMEFNVKQACSVAQRAGKLSRRHHPSTLILSDICVQYYIRSHQVVCYAGPFRWHPRLFSLPFQASQVKTFIFGTVQVSRSSVVPFISYYQHRLFTIEHYAGRHVIWNRCNCCTICRCTRTSRERSTH